MACRNMLVVIQMALFVPSTMADWMTTESGDIETKSYLPFGPNDQFHMECTVTMTPGSMELKDSSGCVMKSYPAPAPPPPPPPTIRRHCDDLLRSGVTKSGEYMVDLDDDGAEDLVYCDMEKDGGGWTFAIKTWYSSGLCGDGGVLDGERHVCNTKGCLEEKINFVPEKSVNDYDRTNTKASYKLSDAKIKAIIGQPNAGDVSKFDVMYTQTGFHASYSDGNYEYATLKDYTQEWTFKKKVDESTSTTTLDVFRLEDHAKAHSTKFNCGSAGWGINCNGPDDSANGGSKCAINLGKANNAGWNHFAMCWSNQDTYAYICNGPQHSSGQKITHMYYFRPARSDNPL